MTEIASHNWCSSRIVQESWLRDLCRNPYPGHPKGCPNWGKKRGCPPSAPLLHEVLDLARPTYLIWNRFDLARHVARMQERHPEWTDRQLYCCLYWQPGARKQLRGVVRRFLRVRAHRRLRVLSAPEAHGANVTESMRRIGHILEWPPREIAYQVAVGGHRRD